jgi:hypothetical protein
MERVLQLKYTTWNVRGLQEKEKDTDKTLNENNTTISIFTESKKKLQGTKEIEDYAIFLQWSKQIHQKSIGVTISIHKLISNRT